MLGLRPFEIALVVFFGIAAIAGLIVFSTYSPDSATENGRYGAQVVIWGTLPEDIVNLSVAELATADQTASVISYVEVAPERFEQELLVAIAEQRSPDLVLVSGTELVQSRARLQPLSYTEFPLRDFQDAYVEAADVFARPEGIYAFPFAVDPLLVYWNRDLFASAGLVAPPTTWEQLRAETIPELTKTTPNRDILQSALAFGEFDNVTHAKEILLLLMLQSGSAMVYERGEEYVVDLNGTSDPTDSAQPASAALTFYTEFSNPSRVLYSWNRSLGQDNQAFLAGKLAMYFGFGSELQSIVAGNPNLNFDVAPVPQGAAAVTVRNYGEVYGFAIPRAAFNRAGAINAALDLTAPAIAVGLTDRLGFAPVHRSTLATRPNDPFLSVTYRAAITVRTWLDPGDAASDGIFATMVNDAVSGRADVGSVINDMLRRLAAVY